MEKNIFLIGFMGAGKSAVSRTLAGKYHMHLVEMDETIEAEQGKKISQIFAEEGEAFFRALETTLLEHMQETENTVISCGGGVPMRQCNVDAMRKSGEIIYLSASPETIFERVKNNHNRPLLEGNMNVAYITQLLAQREPKYQAAADRVIVTDNKSLSDICREIIKGKYEQ